MSSLPQNPGRRRDWPELDEARIKRAFEGDRRAFTAVYETYNLYVRAAVASRMRRMPAFLFDLDDLVDEVWDYLVAKDLKRLRRWNPDRSPFSFFISMLAGQHASGLVHKLYLRGITEVSTSIDDIMVIATVDDVEQDLIDRDLLERLWQRAKESLDEQDLLLLEHVYLRGKPIKEVMPMLDASPRAIYKRSERLMTKLQRLADELLRPERGTRVPDGDLMTITTLLVTYIALYGPGSP